MSTPVDEKRKSPPLDLLVKNLQRFSETGKYSDVTIQATDSKYKVHKTILCAQSKYFELLFEREWKETQENVISFPEDDPRVIKAMVEAIYGRDYTEDSEGYEDQLMFHAEVFIAADKYMVPTLKDDALKNFQRNSKQNWDIEHVVSKIPLLYTKCPQHADTLLQPVKELYCSYVSYVMKLDYFRAMLKALPQLALDLLCEVAEKHPDQWENITCTDCHKGFLVKPGRTLCISCYKAQSKKRKTTQ